MLHPAYKFCPMQLTILPAPSLVISRSSMDGLKTELYPQPDNRLSPRGELSKVKHEDYQVDTGGAGTNTFKHIVISKILCQYFRMP
ncbi:hypothetical protein RRG08_062622 [Elysia crispata]|uniref:Uncharacterized protein n=1 Tax=Elysia crispata TaxID=231223 RepID=A0AAE0YYW1_9GAST|nr:hypothetical protein RRG08_062622 [Elysia crispata]